MAFTRAQILDQWMNPDFKFYVNRGVPKEHEKFLRDANRMRDEYLGACLDYIRWGSGDSVMYEHNTSSLIGFVQQWMNLNEDNLIWHERSPSADFSLPYINTPCPSHNYPAARTIKDRGGRLRCAESDTTNGGKITQCYNILSDRDMTLSLETVLDRLNLNPKVQIIYCPDNHLVIGRPCKRKKELTREQLEEYKETKRCPGHEDKTNETVHPFDGWDLAWYVQRWHEQNDAPVFNPK